VLNYIGSPYYGYSSLYGGAETGPLCFTNYNFRSVDQMAPNLTQVSVISFLSLGLLRGLFESTCKH